jgi:hypothetical protein
MKVKVNYNSTTGEIKGFYPDDIMYKTIPEPTVEAVADQVQAAEVSAAQAACSKDAAAVSESNAASHKDAAAASAAATAVSATQAANSAILAQETAATALISAPVRQTVLSGLVDSNGYAVFLAVVNGALAITLSATTIPLVVAFAAGFDDNGAIDYVGRVTADVENAWSGLTASSTLYLYIERNASTGALSYGFSTSAPTYSLTAPSSPSSGRHWFDITGYKMYYYNGSAWVSCQRVFVGECITETASVSSIICYALQGFYDSGWYAVINATMYNKSDNLGVDPTLKNVSNFFRQSSSYNAAKVEYHFVYNIGFGMSFGSSGLNVTKIYTASRINGSDAVIQGSASSDEVSSGQYRTIVKRAF